MPRVTKPAFSRKDFDWGLAKSLGVVALFMLDEASGCLVDMMSGASAALTSGGVAATTEGRAITFNGSQNQLFNIPLLSAGTYSQHAFVVCGRILATAQQAGNPGQIFGIDASSSQRGWGIGWDNSASPKFGLGWLSNSVAGSIVGSVAGLNVWHTVYAQISNGGTCGVWIDGQSAVTGSITGAIDTNPDEIAFGAQHRSSGFLRNAKGQMLWGAILRVRDTTSIGSDAYNFTDAQAWQLYASDFPYNLFRKSRRPWPAASGGIVSGTGSSSGTSTVTATSAATKSSVGSSSGIGTATATSAATKKSVGASAGTSTVSGVGKSNNAQVGSSAGTATVAATSAATKKSVGSSSGVATAAATSAAIKASVGSSAGTSTVAATSAATKKSVGSAVGTSTVSGIGDSQTSGTATGLAAGTSTVTGVSAAIKASVGASSGTSTAVAIGQDGTPSGTGGWDPYYYKARPKVARLKKQIERVVERIPEEAPREIVQAKERVEAQIARIDVARETAAVDAEIRSIREQVAALKTQIAQHEEAQRQEEETLLLAAAQMLMGDDEEPEDDTNDWLLDEGEPIDESEDMNFNVQLPPEVVQALSEQSLKLNDQNAQMAQMLPQVMQALMASAQAMQQAAQAMHQAAVIAAAPKQLQVVNGKKMVVPILGTMQ